ncbi:hypothetical protein C2I36_12285 [Rhodobacteraceae bacterium WD3A24]|nr:hypothetical protein C2I36_12285 [Rhodobacteraceae bacterium WD3A24]
MADSAAMRAAAAVIAATGAAALSTQPFVAHDMIPVLTHHAASWPRVAWVLSGFFTILTHLANTALMAHLAATGRAPGRLALPALVLALVMTFAIYHTMLADLWSPTGYALWADHALHTVLPVAVLAFWLAFGRLDRLGPATPLSWLAWPAVYAIYALGRGALTGEYPYPFLDPALQGPRGVLTTLAAMAAGFVAGAYALLGLGRVAARLRV